MKLAVLFWFYKDVEICRNRLQLLKQSNAGLKIYGLFGGRIDEAKKFKKRLGPYLDDFYVFSAGEDPAWKWINGDLMILDWQANRGQHLDWDSIAVIQWDMLVFDSLENQLQGIRANQIFLSGVKNMDAANEARWHWTKPGGQERDNYVRFLDHIRKEHSFTDAPGCCLFILAVFPRVFLERYAQLPEKEIGMLEYKLPTYAKILNIPFYFKDLGVQWGGEPPDKPLNAIPREITGEYIKTELAKPHGWRIFHPYFKTWDLPVKKHWFSGWWDNCRRRSKLPTTWTKKNQSLKSTPRPD